MFDMKVFEDDSFVLYLGVGGMGRPSVLVKFRQQKFKATKYEHQYFLACIQAMQSCGLKDTFHDERVKSFYSEYCNAIANPPGYGIKEVFFSRSPDEQAMMYFKQ